MDGPPPVGCKCLPNKCEQSPYPTCGGLCPPGSSCHPSTTGIAKCDCIPDKPCQSVAPHQCDGDCPNSDEICIPGPTDICGCFKLPCTSALAPACDADCPAPFVCRQIPGSTKCECVDPPADATVLFLFDAHLYPSNRSLLEAVQARARALAVALLRDPYDARLLGPGVRGLTAYRFRKCQLDAVIARLVWS